MTTVTSRRQLSRRPPTRRGAHAARVVGLALALSAAGAACAEDVATPVAHVDSALTAQQCSYFAVGDKVQICHRTGSAKNPYVIVRTNVASCGGHALHVGDYVTSSDPTSAIYDPTCNNQGCLPAGAPSDPSIECCDGTASVNGVCAVIDPCAPTAVDDGNPCTVDACSPASGPTHVPVSVDDGNACTVDACAPGTGLVSHTQVVVSDGDLCTTDVCNSATGAIVHIPLGVDDHNACTADACNPSTGAASHVPVGVDDQNACTLDACDPATGVVSHAALVDGTACDDGNPATSGEVCTAGICAATVTGPLDCGGQPVDTSGLPVFRVTGSDGAGGSITVWYAFTTSPAIITYPDYPDVAYYFPDASYRFAANVRLVAADGSVRCFDSLPTDGNQQSANIYIIDSPAGDANGDMYAVNELLVAEAGGTGVVAGFVLFMLDTTSTALSTSALPLTPPALASFDSTWLSLTIVAENGTWGISDEIFRGTPTSLDAQ